MSDLEAFSHCELAILLLFRIVEKTESEADVVIVVIARVKHDACESFLISVSLLSSQLLPRRSSLPHHFFLCHGGHLSLSAHYTNLS